MIHYQLRCTSGSEPHEFDGWFKDSDAFDKLAKVGLVECPACGGIKVERALMAPAIPKKGRPARNAIIEAPAPAPVASPLRLSRPKARRCRSTPGRCRRRCGALLTRLGPRWRRTADYVGKDFADEARKSRAARPRRAACSGETTDAEAEALTEEGIEFARLPWVPPSDA